jgi:cell division transport system ATP-binding protein
MISLDNVGLQYGQKGPEVLHDISFFLPKGSFCWLLGPSGAGKSSLLRLMYLASLPTRGQLTVLGTQISAGNVGAAAREQLAALRRRIGVVFQDFRLLANLSTFDNVALPLRIAGREEAELRSDVTEILQWVGLWRKANIHPPQLSGGEQQRVAIARAVVAGPALLLADEPTGNLDDVQAERLMLLLQQMNRYGTTVVIATHNEALANRHKGRTLRLSDGRLIEDKVHGPMTAAGALLESIR